MLGKRTAQKGAGSGRSAWGIAACVFDEPKVRENAVVDDAGRVYWCLMFNEFSHIPGPRLATPRGGAAYFTLTAGSISISRSQHNLISIFLGTVPDLQVAVASRKPRMLVATPGTVMVAPTGSAVESSWNDRRESILLVIPDGSFDAIIAEEGGHGRDVFDRSPYKTYDRRVLGAAEQIRSELSKSHANELLIGSLITVIGVHLLRDQKHAAQSEKGGLSHFQVKLLADHLEMNLSRKVTVMELAEIAGLSRDYFVRAFSRSFGEPPHRYLVHRRLELAERLLTESQLSIADIAYECGFSSQSHLTATMRKHRMRTPMEMRRSS